MSLILSHYELFAFAEWERERYEDLLKAFVKVPTVSSETDRQRDIKRGLNWQKKLSVVLEAKSEFTGAMAVIQSSTVYLITKKIVRR